MCLGTENSCQVQRIPTAKTTVRACAYMPLSLLSGRLWGDDIKGGAKYQRWELWQRKHIHKSHLISMCLWIPSLVSKHILEKKVEDTRVISSCLGPNSHLRNPFFSYWPKWPKNVPFLSTHLAMRYHRVQHRSPRAFEMLWLPRVLAESLESTCVFRAVWFLFFKVFRHNACTGSKTMRLSLRCEQMIFSSVFWLHFYFLHKDESKPR